MAAAACDQGVQHDQVPYGPPIHVVDANIGATQPLAVDDPIQISFDRYLNPLTVTRQAFALRDAFNQAPVNPTVAYDPVRRVVTLSNPSEGKPWLIVGQPYKVIISAAASPDDLALRSIDGSGLTKTVVLGFFAAPARGRPKDPVMSFCRDVFPILESCNQCHFPAEAGGKPWAGLDLFTESGIERTAKNRVSQATNTGARSTGAPPGPIFGIDMPIIDPGNPGNSFLIYKLLLRAPEERSTTCITPPQVVPNWDVATLPRDDDEADNLANVIPGRAMPPFTAKDPRAVSDAQLERLRLWIQQGATVESCAACTP